MDKLTLALLGKYKKNKLEVNATLNSFDMSSDDMALQMLKKQMRELIADQIIEFKYLKISEMPQMYNEVGKPFYGKCYCFSQEELCKLIDDAFEMGRLAAESPPAEKS